MKDSLKRRWVVPTAALLISLTIGASAWAATDGATGTTDPTASGTAEVTAAGPGLGDLMFGGGGHHGGGMRGGLGGPDGLALTDEQKQALEERRQEMEARRDAMLDLIGDKMSAEDQAAFDDLRATAEEQQAALEQARLALQDTMQQIRDLTDKYLDAATTGDTSSGTTSATGTSGTGSSVSETAGSI